VAEAWR